MGSVETFTGRNAEFAAGGGHAGLRMMPTMKTIVIGCVDPRVDPSSVLGADLGEVAVIRNVGGRVTPAVLDELAILRGVTQAAGGEIGPGWELIVLQHTDCGITRVLEKTELLASFFGVAAAELGAKAIDDPRAAVALDVAVLKADGRQAPGRRISGLVYDVATGLVETVVTPD